MEGAVCIMGVVVLFFMMGLAGLGGKTTACSACGGKVSKEAAVCPHCGHPQ